MLCSSGMASRSPPWARVAGAEVTAHTEREGKRRTILFMHLKANIFIACPCIVCLYWKKNQNNSWPFFAFSENDHSLFPIRSSEKSILKDKHCPSLSSLVFFFLWITVLMEMFSFDSSVMPTVFFGRCYFGVHPSWPTCKYSLNFKFANAEIGAGHCTHSGGEEDSPGGSCSGKEVFFFSG